MTKGPNLVLFVCLLLALAVNCFFFFTGTELTTVVTRTMFGNIIIVLTMVPIYEAIRLKSMRTAPDIAIRVKEAMKPVAIYTLLIALTTFILFKLFGEELIAQRIAQLQELLAAATEMAETEKQQRLDSAQRIYAPGTQVLMVLFSTLFTGFVSSILAALVVRKG